MKEYSNIPEKLKNLPCWVSWRLEERNGKKTKVPINPMTGKGAMSNNPSTWGTFNQAVEGVNKYNCNGIGFMFNGDGIVGVDIDHCADSLTGVMTEEAKEIILTLKSYTEYSQSGTGIHIICEGELPQGPRRKGNVEMYCTGRYFIMTGNLVEVTP